MLTPEQTAEMAALKAERADLARIIRAPIRLGDVAARMMQLERAAERAEARALADAASPGWRERLAAAEAELAAATAEDTRLYDDAAMRAQAAVIPVEYRTNSLPGRIGEIAPGLAGLVPPVSSDPVRAMAGMHRTISLRRVESLRSYPARLARATGRPPDPATEAPTRRRIPGL